MARMHPTYDAAGRLHQLAGDTDGVITRRDARHGGVTRRRIAQEVARGRWEVARRAVKIVGAPATLESAWRLALAGASPRAALDGVSALQCAGMVGFEDLVHLSVPKGDRVIRDQGVRVHELRSWDDADVLELPVRRVRPELATLRAARWAVSERAAQTILAMSVQQGLTTPQRLITMLERLPRSRRAALIAAAVSEIAGGSQALGELDLVRLCRSHDLPVPARQQLLRRPSGTYYLDARFAAYALTVEVDGLGHRDISQTRVDQRKHNELQIDGDVVLRVMSMDLRDDPEPFLRQLRRALMARGWGG
ncbi:hypothetical protein [Allobranchiibius sp. CTAmp26]|uniref:hypothetical protein n=1 Tax=Allobranchiibius sp. CTAmp26 TaxID=2815214 RepID=UPI001AA17C51|nr:hypothetical protein [Allobranchiibius sp. CTAmp26]MBO1755788.1 hypothetical protein [Allobranchiibius sp. CTAmp26]